MSDKRIIELTVNREAVRREVGVRKNLVDFIRDDLGFTGTHVGCEHGVCGACTIRVNGRAVRGCLMFAVQANCCDIETIEGLTASGVIEDLQATFVARNAAQCGFCTPGMLVIAAELLEAEGSPDRDEIREFISGNICRCTGYQAIVDAIEATLKNRRRP